MTKKRAYVIVSGVVQGVGYRFFIRKRGQAAGVRGFVRNLPDGRVDAVLEGEEDNVQDMITTMKRGPYGAVVEDIDIEWSDYTGEFHGFDVWY